MRQLKHSSGSKLCMGFQAVRVFTVLTQQTLNICITFVQRRPNVFDVGPTLFKCYTTVLCLLGRYVVFNFHDWPWTLDKWTSTSDLHCEMIKGSANLCGHHHKVKIKLINYSDARERHELRLSCVKQMVTRFDAEGHFMKGSFVYVL